MSPEKFFHNLPNDIEIEEIPEEAYSFPEQKTELRQDKLVDATDLQGIKNEKVFSITKDLEQKFSKYPEFIGVFPFGSSVKGYATSEYSSDYDIDIVLDGNISWNAELYHDLDNAKREAAKDNIRVQFVDWHFSQEDFNREAEHLEELHLHEDTVYQFKCAAILSQIGRGEKVTSIRKEIKNEIAKLPESEKDELFKTFVDFLTERDRTALEKIKERVPDLREDEYMDSRRKLWGHRIEFLFSERPNED